MEVELTLDFKELNSIKHSIKDNIDILKFRIKQLKENGTDEEKIKKLESKRIIELQNYRKVNAALDFFYDERNSDRIVKAEEVEKHVQEALQRGKRCDKEMQ